MWRLQDDGLVQSNGNLTDGSEVQHPPLQHFRWAVMFEQGLCHIHVGIGTEYMQ
jgi:hypothetical protein